MANRLPFVQRPTVSYHIRRALASAGLDSGGQDGYNTSGKGAATSGWPDQESNSMARNRHRAGWRFLRFTTMVTVYGPMCNVIRMSLTPFRVVWPTACRLCSARRYLTISDGLWQAPGLTAAGTAGIIAVERALRQAVGPVKSNKSHRETVTWQSGGLCFLR